VQVLDLTPARLIVRVKVGEVATIRAPVVEGGVPVDLTGRTFVVRLKRKGDTESEELDVTLGRTSPDPDYDSVISFTLPDDIEEGTDAASVELVETTSGGEQTWVEAFIYAQRDPV
jgi:hypothetical protein